MLVRTTRRMWADFSNQKMKTPNLIPFEVLNNFTKVAQLVYYIFSAII